MDLLNVILGSGVSVIASYFTILNFTKEQFNLKNFLLYGLILIVLVSLSCIYFTGFTKLILIILFMTMMLYATVFKKDISNAIYYAVVYELFVCVFEIIISALIVFIFNIDSTEYAKFPFSLLISSIVNSGLIYIFTKWRFISKNIIKINDNLKKNNKDWIYVFLVIILLILLMIFNRYNMNATVEYYICIVMFIFIIVSLIYVIYCKIQKRNVEKRYNESMEYVQRYEKIINEQGKKNHEYNNQLMVIRGYKDNPEKLDKYLDLVTDEHKTGQNYTVKQLGYLPDGGIKGLLYHKLSKMQEKGVKQYLYIDQNIKKISDDALDMKTYMDVTKLLGVFIDNAIDATVKSKEKEIDIDMKIQKNCLLICISNTYDTNVDISKVGKKGYSTKGVGHGYGLAIVRDISKTNSKIETFSENDGNNFMQTAIIYLDK